MSKDVQERLERRTEELAANDPQFAAARANETIAAAIENAAPRLPQVVKSVLEGYSDRPALAQRAVELVKELAARAAANINCGYIALPFDKRELPNELPVSGGSMLDSFALAVTRACRPRAAQEASYARVFGSYLPQDRFDAPGMTYSAHDVMRRDRDTLSALNGQVVIVGADWTRSPW